MTPLEIASIAAAALLALFVLSCACLCSCRCLLRQRRSRLRAGDVMIISGASSGIGEHVAYCFAGQGLHLVLAARRVDRLRGVAARCGELGAASATPVQADVTSSEDCAAIVQRAIDRHGRVDALVVNAGVGCFAPVTDLGGVGKLLRVMARSPAAPRVAPHARFAGRELLGRGAADSGRPPRAAHVQGAHWRRLLARRSHRVPVHHRVRAAGAGLLSRRSRRRSCCARRADTPLRSTHFTASSTPCDARSPRTWQ